MKENTIKAALAAALGALCAYGIQLLVPVLVLLVVMVLDYITGMTKAWNAGELSSRVGLWGILKKVGYLVIVGVACVVDWLLRYGADSLGWNWPVDFLFASIVIIWLVINELLSILENVSAIGAPVPGFMQALLKKLKVHTEDTAEENLPGEENNPQMKLYALGALLKYNTLFDIDSVRMTIFQPRLSGVQSSDEITVKELLEWAEKYVKPHAR